MLRILYKNMDIVVSVGTVPSTNKSVTRLSAGVLGPGSRPDLLSTVSVTRPSGRGKSLAGTPLKALLITSRQILAGYMPPYAWGIGSGCCHGQSTTATRSGVYPANQISTHYQLFLFCPPPGARFGVGAGSALHGSFEHIRNQVGSVGFIFAAAWELFDRE